jgi:hypothetical protein
VSRKSIKIPILPFGVCRRDSGCGGSPEGHPPFLGLEVQAVKIALCRVEGKHDVDVRVHKDHSVRHTQLKDITAPIHKAATIDSQPFGSLFLARDGAGVRHLRATCQNKGVSGRTKMQLELSAPGTSSVIALPPAPLQDEGHSDRLEPIFV